VVGYVKRREDRLSNKGKEVYSENSGNDTVGVQSTEERKSISYCVLNSGLEERNWTIKSSLPERVERALYWRGVRKKE